MKFDAKALSVQRIWSFFFFLAWHSGIVMHYQYHTKFGYIQKVSYGQSNWFFLYIFTMTLTLKKLNTAIQSFHKTFWFTMIYYQAVWLHKDQLSFHTLAPTSGTISPKTSGTLLLSLPSKVNSRHFSSQNIWVEPHCPSLPSVCTVGACVDTFFA